MNDDIRPGFYRIVSKIEGNPPVGVGNILPTRQNVSLGGIIHDWMFMRVDDGDSSIFRLSVSGHPFTGVENDKVIVSIVPGQIQEVKWRLTRREPFWDAYTITLAEDPNRGWTVPSDDPEDRSIEIRPIRETKSIPPQFSPTQLFQIRRID